MHAQSTMEKIELLEKQISVVTKSEEQRQCYGAALEKLESDLDELKLPTSKL